MIPEIARVWSAMWNGAHHPDRPWWTQPVLGGVMGLGPSRDHFHWQRADGVVIEAQMPESPRTVGESLTPRGWRRAGAHKRAPLWIDAEAAMAAIDKKQPLPPPPPMPGQVWWWSEKEQATVVDIRGGTPIWNSGCRPESYQADATRRAQARSPHTFHLPPKEADYVWPPPGAVLVAGPTPWGRDVPWSP